MNNKLERTNTTCLLKSCKSALSFPEIVVAIFVFSVLATPLYMLLSNTKTDTAKAIHFFRAMELAQEAIEWAQITTVDKDYKKKIENYSGSIVVEDGKSFKPARINTQSNKLYGNQLLTSNEVEYSSQYLPPFFFRTIEVKDLSSSSIAGNFLKKVVVTVYWNDGKKAKNLHVPDGREKKVVLETLIFDGKKQL